MKPLIAIMGAGHELAEVLERRFGDDYEVVVSADPAEGENRLRSAAESQAPVALVIAPVWAQGIGYLAQVRDIHPGAQRVLVILVGDVAAQADIRRALTLNQIDFFFGIPWASPEEELYPVVGEALRLWARAHQPRYDKAMILDGEEAGRGREIRVSAKRRRPPPELPVHEGHDWFYVLTGRLRLLLGEEDLTIEPGEVVEFSTLTPHWFSTIDGAVELIAILGPHGERLHLHAS